LALNLESGKFETIIKAYELKKIIKRDTVPFVSLTSSKDGYLLTSEFVPAIYEFKKEGTFIKIHTTLNDHTKINGYLWSDYIYQQGILDIISNHNSLTYFIKRRDGQNESVFFEKVNFDLNTAEYWIYKIQRVAGENIKLLTFKDNKLYYLQGSLKHPSVIKVVLFE
jgi:hypothetical protein